MYIFLPRKILLELNGPKFAVLALNFCFEVCIWILIFKWRKYRRVCYYSLTGREEVIRLILSHVNCCKCFYLKFSHDFIVSAVSTSLLSREVWPFVGPQELCDIIKAKKRAIDGVRVTSWTSTLPLPSEFTHGVGHNLYDVVELGKVMLSTWFQNWSQFHTFPATATIRKNTTYLL